MDKVRIVGVPEHFNFPWHLAIESGDFAKVGIDLEWTEIPEGTGKMCSMLRDGSTDIAVILTEGIVKDIIDGNPSKIVQVYVQSPLVWGIHVAAGSKFQTLEELRGAKAAISRFGSGSHLMAVVNAKQMNWDHQNLKFEIVNTIDGAVEALTSGKADYFMWERFMTKPLVDKGIFRRLGDCPTPWPCFVIAVRNEFLEKHPNVVKNLLRVSNMHSTGFKKIKNIDLMLSVGFHQKVNDINQWLSSTEWSQMPLSEDVLNKVQNQLLELSLIDKKGTFAEMVKAL